MDDEQKEGRKEGRMVCGKALFRLPYIRRDKRFGHEMTNEIGGMLL